MGTELLKEQYSLLINDQKNKLEKLKQKKLTQQKQKITNEEKFGDENEFVLFDEKENMNNDLVDDDLFAKFGKFDNLDSSDEENFKKKNNSKKTAENKILIKRNNLKRNEKPNLDQTNAEQLDTTRDSLSINDKLREMKDENGRLRKLLAEKEYEINYLKKKMDEEKNVLGPNPISGDVAASKIVELSKKVRELTAYYESEKTKSKQLQKKCQELEVKFENASKKLNSRNNEEGDFDYEDEENEEEEEYDEYGNVKKIKAEKKVSLSKENKELKEKLNQTSHKMMEFKSQAEILRQDLKRVQKALEKEVGENYDVKTILSGQGNWRGRQQQIRTLQNKIVELKQQVGILDARGSQQLLDDDELDDLGKDGIKSAPYSLSSSAYTLGSNRTNLDLKHKNEIRKLDRERREQYEKLKRDFEITETEMNAVKEKFEAVKSRNKVIGNENKTLKDQVKTLLEKGKHDDELIEALMKKQNQLKEAVENLTVQNEKTSKQVEEKDKEAQIKSMQEKNTLDQLKQIIVQKETRVRQLEKELSELRESVIQSKPNGAVQQFFMHSENRDESFTSLNQSDWDNKVNQKNNSSNKREASGGNNLFRNRSDSSHLNERDISSRNSTRANNSRGNQRPASSSSLNAKAIEQKKEKNVDFKLELVELKTLSKSSEIERVRLMELVKTLQKRNEELNEKSMDSENKLNEQKRKCVSLEKQVEKLKLQDQKNSNNNKKPLINSSSMDQYKLEELETSLLIQKDENDALKAALKSTLEAKEEDLRSYVEMLESTKMLFLDGIKQYKQMVINDKT